MTSYWTYGILGTGLLMACGGGTTDPDPSPPPPAAPVVTTVELAPNNPTVFMGDTVQLTATVKDQRGSVMTGKQLAWSSSAVAVATVDSTGRVVALTSGSATISAAVENKTGSVLLTSTGPGTTGGASGSANIGSAGGSVQATLPGGGTVSLTIPSGAIARNVTVVLDPVVPPPGALASFQISPPGLRLNVPASLVIKVSTGAKVRPTTMAVFERGGKQLPIPSTPNVAAGTVTVVLPVFGLPASASPSEVTGALSARTSVNASGSNINVVNGTLALRFIGATIAMDDLKIFGTVAAADQVQLAMEALTSFDIAAAVDARFDRLAADWAVEVCKHGNFAFSTLASFNVVSDYRGFERLAGEVINWSRVARTMTTYLAGFTPPFAGCNNIPNPQTRINTRLTTLQQAITADLNAFAIEPSPRDSLFFADRLKPLLDLSATLALVGFTPEAQLVSGFIPPQLARMRAVGYARCGSTPRDQEIQGRLIRAMLVGPLPGLSAAEIEDDIELCGMLIQWEVLDSAGTSRLANGSVGGGIRPGQVLPNGSATLFGDGQLRLSSGRLQALLCPAPASANAEQLEILAGRNTQSLSRVAVLSPSNQNTYLAVSPLVIRTDTLRRVAGIAAGDSGVVTVVIQRIGGVCSGMFANLAHSPLGRITLTLAKEILFKFDADLEGWSPGNLRNPAGPPPWGVVIWDSQNGKGVVNMDGKDATAADVGPNATLTKSIAMPAGATTLSYDVSAHNRPNSNVRYRVLINGQLLRDEVLFGPQPPAFNYVPRSLNIAAFAGQTVTIVFELHDNGNNGVFPGTSKHVYLDNIRIR